MNAPESTLRVTIPSDCLVCGLEVPLGKMWVVFGRGIMHRECWTEPRVPIDGGGYALFSISFQP